MTTKRKRPEPSARGQLQKSPLAHLLAYSYERQINGSIELVTPDGRAGDIVIADGYIAKVRTSEPVALLSRVLLELGYANNATLEHYSRKGDVHGELLLEAQEVTEKQLNHALRVQLVRKLSHLFSLPPETRFTFLREFNVLHDYGGHFFHTTHPFQVIWTGTCEHPPWEHVKATLTPLKSARLRTTKDSKMFRFQFQSDVQRIADAIQTRAFTMQDIANSGLPPAIGQLFLYCLLITKQIEIAETTAATAAPSGPLGASEDKAAAVLGSGGLINDETVAALRAAAATPKKNVPPPGSPAAANAAALRQTGEHAAPISAPPAAGNKRSIPPDLTTLPPGGMGDITLELDMSPGGAQKGGNAKPSRQTMQPARKPMPSSMGFESQMGEVAKGDIRRTGENLSVTEGGIAFDRAEQALRSGDLANAEAWCRKALDTEPAQAKFVAFLAWIDSKRPERQNQKGMLECIAAIDRAIAVNDRCAEAFYYRGMLFKRVSESAKAVRDFRHAAELNPRLVEAVNEVRYYEERTRGR